MEITIKAKWHSEVRVILAKYYNKRAGYIVKRPDSNYYDCYDCKNLEPVEKEIDYNKVKKYLSSKINHVQSISNTQ